MLAFSSARLAASACKHRYEAHTPAACARQGPSRRAGSQRPPSRTMARSMSSVSGTPSITLSPRQITPSQSKMKQSTLSRIAFLSAALARWAAADRAETGADSRCWWAAAQAQAAGGRVLQVYHFAGQAPSIRPPAPHGIRASSQSHAWRPRCPLPALPPPLCALLPPAAVPAPCWTASKLPGVPRPCCTAAASRCSCAPTRSSPGQRLCSWSSRREQSG